mmetsp:Transcript_45248/g.109519  ORF Transcript_45248/g.109519 Transcript_45248/m.109519 type:complete len:255 (+) Transcript_45248:3807-4571(+)
MDISFHRGNFRHVGNDIAKVQSTENVSIDNSFTINSGKADSPPSSVVGCQEGNGQIPINVILHIDKIDIFRDQGVIRIFLGLIIDGSGDGRGSNDAIRHVQIAIGGNQVPKVTSGLFSGSILDTHSITSASQIVSGSIQKGNGGGCLGDQFGPRMITFCNHVHEEFRTMTSPFGFQQALVIFIVELFERRSRRTKHGQLDAHFFTEAAGIHQTIDKDLHAITGILIRRFPGEIGKITNRRWLEGQVNAMPETSS